MPSLLATLRRRSVRLTALVGLTAGALTATSAGPAPAAGPLQLRVATYNLQAGAGHDGRFDLNRTAAAIRALNADVVGLQEVDVHWGARSRNRNMAGELARRLGMRVCFAPIYSHAPTRPGGKRRQYGVAVLSRHPIVECTNHRLTRLPTQGRNPTPRVMPGFAEAVIRVGRTRVHVYSTHLDYRADPRIRRIQVTETLRILGRDPKNAPQILTGDLNTDPGAPELVPLWGRLRDTFKVAGTGPGGTYSARTPTRRIDYVAVSRRVSVRAARVPGTRLAATASDHRPVVAVVHIPR